MSAVATNVIGARSRSHGLWSRALVAVLSLRRYGSIARKRLREEQRSNWKRNPRDMTEDTDLTVALRSHRISVDSPQKNNSRRQRGPGNVSSQLMTSDSRAIR
jgi:hypothetical protein